MTPEQINRACAELCGWKLAPWSKDDRGRPMEPVEMWFAPGETIPHEMFPLHRFTTSLDAAQMAFKSLSEEEQEACTSILCDLVAFDSEGWTETQVVKLMKATPAQWCEAILRAVEKWSGNEAT